MIPVIVESPFASNKFSSIENNIKYARVCMRDCLLKNESPFASHLLYTQHGVLNDDIPEERELGIQAGFIWRKYANKTVVYTDLGISRGMEYGIKHAKDIGHTIEYRTLGGIWVVS